MTRALILVDIQNDFMPTGALPVPDGDAVVQVANAAQHHFDLIVSTQDFHPKNHGSFAANHSGRSPGEVIKLHGLKQVLWPTHCVQGTHGADFVAELNTTRIARVFPKGVHPTVDSYSGFFDNGHRHNTGLSAYLRKQCVDTVYLLGVATDYCIKFTALDARSEGFKTYLVEDGCRGVDLQPGDSQAAIHTMCEAGVQIITSDALKI